MEGLLICSFGMKKKKNARVGTPIFCIRKLMTKAVTPTGAIRSSPDTKALRKWRIMALNIWSFHGKYQGIPVLIHTSLHAAGGKHFPNEPLTVFRLPAFRPLFLHPCHQIQPGATMHGPG